MGFDATLLGMKADAPVNLLGLLLAIAGLIVTLALGIALFPRAST